MYLFASTRKTLFSGKEYTHDILYLTGIVTDSPIIEAMHTRESTIPLMQSSEQCVIRISRPPIRLGQFLKHAGIVENGLEAKIRILNGEVTVNGQRELRRGRQLCHGDRISMAGSLYIVECLG